MFDLVNQSLLQAVEAELAVLQSQLAAMCFTLACFAAAYVAIGVTFTLSVATYAGWRGIPIVASRLALSIVAWPLVIVAGIAALAVDAAHEFGQRLRTKR